MYVVVDADKADLTRIKRIVADKSNVELVVVPSTYKTRAVAKGRAIQYFIDHYVGEGEWYAFLDDDNLVLDTWYRRDAACMEKQNRLIGNPVLVPRPGRSLHAYVMDHIRWLDDLTVFRLFTGVLGYPYAGLHGELLLVRGDVLKRVGFNRSSIVEDYAFGVAASRMGIRTFQTRTRVSILSPHSLRDLIRQRNRWWCGLKHEVPRSPPGFILTAGLRLFLWRIGVIGTLAFAPLHYLLGVGGDWLIPLFTPGFLYYMGAYLFGATRVYRNHGLLEAVKTLAALPIYGVVENLAPWIKCSGEFTVIDKT